MTYIIGEIGINHNGSLENAKTLIHTAASMGFDAVKFQKRTPRICVPEGQKNTMRETPWGEMTYLDYKEKLEFGHKEYHAIDKLCDRLGIEWSASPWDMQSLDFLNQYKLPWIKIASASIVDLELIRECARRYERILLSTGMSTMEEISDAVDAAGAGLTVGLMGPRRTVTLLHCNSSYPAPVDKLNLNCIKTLAKEFPNCHIGYSGHEYGLTTTIASVALGARVIERHITLDKTMWGTDQMCSVEPHGMLKLVRGIRELEAALGDGKKQITSDELEKAATQRA